MVDLKKFRFMEVDLCSSDVKFIEVRVEIKLIFSFFLLHFSIQVNVGATGIKKETKRN